jgi:tyrosinase
MAIRTRRDVWKLTGWDPVLLWYAKAIAKMQAKPLNDPTGWRYQAAIHDYIRENDPNAQVTDQLPPAPMQRLFWMQCQHNSWYFLPWHRMYLAVFEQIVTKVIVEIGGPSDWALPYWNYSDSNNPNAAKLPPAFRAANLPDGSINPLFVDQRNPGCNAGNVIADNDETDITQCMAESSYTAARIGGNPGFGGPATRFSHAGRVTGKLELTPHGSMHVAVGGWMGAFETAALDPIFWLHHSNIDRLWAVWIARNALHLNPTDPAWLTALPFTFHDANGTEASMTPAQVVDTRQAPLSYEYEDISDPLAPSAVTEAARMVRPERFPEMVGATEAPVDLGDKRADIAIRLTTPTGPAALESVDADHEVYLNFENITASGPPENYSVYLNLPTNADPAKHPELMAGTLSTFGAAESTRADAEHGSGLHHVLPVTDVVSRLKARNNWNPERVNVTLVPKHRRHGQAGALETVEAPIKVGRMSLYYS